MRWAYNILRAIAVIAFTLGVVIPVSLYIALSTNWVQDKIKDIGQQELSNLLGTDVKIEKLSIKPFNRLSLENVSVADDFGKTALTTENIDARFELFHFLRTGNIVIDYVSIDKPKFTLYKADAKSPINIANIIAKLTKKDENKPPTHFKLAINTVEITEGDFSYDILDAPKSTVNKFNDKHISLTGITAYATLPVVSDKAVTVDIEHLSFEEKSGFKVVDLIADIAVDKTIDINNLELQLPRTHLQFSDLHLPKDLNGYGQSHPAAISIGENNNFCPADFAAFAPALKELTRIYNIRLAASGTVDDFYIRQLNISPTTDNEMSVSAIAAGGYRNGVLDIKNSEVKVNATALEIGRLMAAFDLKPDIRNTISKAGNIAIQSTVSGTISKEMQKLTASLMANTSLGNIDVDGDYHHAGARHDIDISAIAENINLYQITNNHDLGNLTANLQFTGSVIDNKPLGDAAVTVSKFDYKGINLDNLDLTASIDSDGMFTSEFTLDNNQIGYAQIDASGVFEKTIKSLIINGNVDHLQIAKLVSMPGYSDYTLSSHINTDLVFADNNIYGNVTVGNFAFASSDDDRSDLFLRQFTVQSSHDESTGNDNIDISSDFINGNINGTFNWQNIAADFNRMAAIVLPEFIHEKSLIGSSSPGHNNFKYSLTISDAENFSDFVHLPVKIIYPVSVNGHFDYGARSLSATIDAPWLQQGDKIIEGTKISARLDGESNAASATAHTSFPTKKGDMDLDITLSGADNRINTDIDWLIKREKPINGNLSFSTLLGRDANSHFVADVTINPGDITFGDDVWHINNSMVRYMKDYLEVDMFRMSTLDQSLAITGLCTAESNSKLSLDINNLNLISIFETLDINNALIGGRASGQISVSDIFSSSPHVWSDGLNVKNISYNYCVIGDALVKTHFDAQRKCFYIDADIDGNNGDKSRIYGDIYTAGERLDINFDAKHVEIGFMKPFMQAFAADLSGTASGRARLFGTFKDIDLEGDLYAENLGIKLDFTNTWYYATDSVHIAPGNIQLKDITIRDPYGNTALLNGYVHHQYFHNPDFEFNVTNARNLLCYNVTSKTSPDWYGRIFGNGGASVTGRPGVVDIAVNMTTTENSTFTFVLSDQLDADDYTFISFRDATPVNPTDTINKESKIPKEVIEYRNRVLASKQQENVPTVYNMDIRCDITPAAKLIVIMDPVGGDAIKANGSGNFRLTYASVGNDLHMYGTYTIERGSYNFTLQDIIVKDFTINEGSSITFTGDPYAASLDIKALYTVNANLSDLDESFLQDKDLNRTNVPVQAVLMAKGDMRQPDISFDLEFPTLSTDVYRKVRSIVNTEDMMNRQILYLLALNRFYTPEYMQTTKGSELFSVASSTISSQLSNMLGKFSENWSIAPNLRSDRGDFTDLEVDVALSSNLLNNRLRLNGNFGYRDKSLNTNQFIGDFDLEYLLNRSGSWRLKAYNRYNDQNYYLRTATTTQGVGIMFKRDFDDMFKWLRTKANTSTDTIQKPSNDSIN